MPRAPREKSSTGVYHVMLRGINRQIIFEDDEDYQKYLDTLKTYQEKSGYIIYAYCLMSQSHSSINEGSSRRPGDCVQASGAELCVLV